MRTAWLVALAACGRFGFDPSAPPDEPPAPDAPPPDAPAGYRASAVSFQRAGNDYMWTTALQNTVSSSRGVFSAWFRFTDGDGDQQVIVLAQVLGVGGILRQASGRFRFIFQNCAGVPMLDMQSRGTYTTESGWVHVLAAWDLGAGRADLYLDGNEDRSAAATIINGPICYDSFRWGIGGLDNGQLDADVADFYAQLGAYVDLADAGNRARFRDAAGHPVNLGASCQNPTAAPSTGCFVGDPATWNINQGTAAGFNLEGDGLVAAPTSPSD